MDFKGKAKWDAWNGKKGMSQDEAKQKYVDLANSSKRSMVLPRIEKHWRLCVYE